MADAHMLLFPICIKKYKEIYKMYIPSIDMETRANDYTEALGKARRLIQSSFVLDEIDKTMLSAEEIPALLKERQLEDYLDAQIVYIDFVDSDRYDMSELTLQIPKYLIDDIKNESIDYTRVFKDSLEEILRRKRIFNEIRYWTGKTVNINNGDYFGQIKSIDYKKNTPWNFTVSLKTGISDSIKLHPGVIEEIEEMPVAMNELGTFRTVNQDGLISVSGKLWWKKGHIDVYLEYDSSVGIDDQKSYELLAEFNKKKYEWDEVIRQNIATQLIKKDIILRLFEDYEEDDLKKRIKHILEELMNRTELWFIDISSSKNVYMDYNFSNGTGKYNVGVTKNLGDDSFVFVLNDVTIFSDLDDEYDEDEEDDD